MTRLVWALGPWLALGGAAGQSHEGLRNADGNSRQVQVETYDVAGDTAAEIRRELSRRGPLSGGKRFDARTEWTVRWWFDVEPEAGGCRVLRPRVDLHVLVTLPRWRREAEAPAELVERWERFLAALREHEQGHRAIGFAAADELQAMLFEQPAARDCAEARRRANRLGHEIVARRMRDNDRYDQRTQHGASEGARFP